MTKAYVIASPVSLSGRGNLARWDRFRRRCKIRRGIPIICNSSSNAERSLILGYGTVAIKTIKALTQGDAERPIMAAPQGFTG